MTTAVLTREIRFWSSVETKGQPTVWNLKNRTDNDQIINDFHRRIGKEYSPCPQESFSVDNYTQLCYRASDGRWAILEIDYK